MMLKDKVALVTGGTSGIGRATAIAYAQQQAKVVVVGRRMDEGEETVRLIKEAGGEAIFVQADVIKEADVKAMVDKAVSVFGRLDIAFNNAGTVGENPSLIEQTEAEYDRITNVNIKGVWLAMKYEIAQMLKQGSGSIVNTASANGVVAFPTFPLYTASKHIDGFSVLHREQKSVLNEFITFAAVCLAAPWSLCRRPFTLYLNHDRFTIDIHS